MLIKMPTPRAIPKLQTTLELDYARLFPVPQTPQQCFYADDYDLRQPSALKYVPSTTSPTAEV